MIFSIILLSIFVFVKTIRIWGLWI